LIELLVVVAIIALLISILLPSLSGARNQARLLTCKVNLKQIGTTTAVYQSEYGGAVPIMYNYYANGQQYWDAPARACWLSVALRDYFGELEGLEHIRGGRFNPEERWDNSTREEYEHEIMPDFFVCPFVRGQKGEPRTLIKEDRFFRISEWQGRHEYYQTFMWESIVRDRYPHNQPWPGSPPGGYPDKRGLPKYSTLSWNSVGLTSATDDPKSDQFQSQRHRRWTPVDAKRQETGSLADLTAAFCALGEHNVHTRTGRWGRTNVGGHQRGGEGGTNVMMGDTHVEWVVGTRVGWP
jgi:type II secretory pathway pseudopilin PulG